MTTLHRATEAIRTLIGVRYGCALLVALCVAGSGFAQIGKTAGEVGSAEPKANPNVGFEQKLGDKIPLDLAFTDENGERVTLGQCVNGKPTILILAYYRCPMLCGEVIAGVLDACRLMKTVSIGKEFNVLTVSFDPLEKPGLALAKKRRFVQEYGRKEADLGWKFLTGEQENIDKLTKAVGFKYEYDKTIKEYNHDSGITIITPEGIISRYMPGIEYIDRGENGKILDDPARTLRLSLVEAGDGKIGSLADQAFLSCYRYNEHTGKYSANVMLMVRGGGVLTLALIVAFFAWRSWSLPGVRVLVVNLVIFGGILLAVRYAPLPDEQWRSLPKGAQRGIIMIPVFVMALISWVVWKTTPKKNVPTVQA